MAERNIPLRLARGLQIAGVVTFLGVAVDQYVSLSSRVSESQQIAEKVDPIHMPIPEPTIQAAATRVADYRKLADGVGEDGSQIMLVIPEPQSLSEAYRIKHRVEERRIAILREVTIPQMQEDDARQNRGIGLSLLAVVCWFGGGALASRFTNRRHSVYVNYTTYS